MGHWMFNCQEVSRMVSASLDRRLPLYQRAAVRMHLAMCRYCSRLRRQLLMLKEAARQDDAAVTKSEDQCTLSPEARQRIKENICGHTAGHH